MPHDTLRADAQQNRDRILKVAHDAFARSSDASLNSIAKQAGVGAGTLYRHFPTREALLLAVYRHDVQTLVDSVPQMLDEYEPLDAFRLWFERLAGYVRIKHGLGDALHTAAAQDVVDQTYAPVTAAIAALLRSCADAGALRPDLEAGDVLLLMSCLWRIDSSDDGETQAARLFKLAVDGLRVVA
jgi:AcrR family transcriptional regulator